MIGMATVYASITGMRIILRWDINSGSEMQLVIERKTYLVSTVLNYTMGCELFSLFLFISMADNIHTLFIGAMCAAGTLNAGSGGYPALMLKMVNFLLCGTWIIVNHIDNKGFDYPLIRFKYKLLIPTTLLILAEGVVQTNYLLSLEPEIITSCCAILFSENTNSVAGEIVHLPPFGTMIAYYLGFSLLLATGVRFYLSGKGAVLFSIFNASMLFISLAAVISFISLYFYELPTHHCPFCLLQKEYHYIGYILYLSLLFASIAGCAAGLVDRFNCFSSLKCILPKIQKRLCIGSMAGHTLFAAISTYPILFSDFRLQGY
jgi:hypothetical protein